MRHNLNRTITVIFASLILFISSCEKEVHIKMVSAPAQVVVQGGIETGMPPYVLLTTSIGFFSNVDLTTLQNSFLHGAVITVSDGSRTVTLKEYPSDTSVASSLFFIYSLDTADHANVMLGEEGKFYTLNIKYNGQTYTSVTKIPVPKPVDSMWFDIPQFKNSKTPDSAMQLFINYKDPDTLGNFVRYYTRINSQQYYASDQFNDQVVNGALLTDIPLYAGYEHVKDAKEDSLRYFYPGDTVTLKWCEIDKNVYNFWNSFAYAENALGNPFASPINLQTNITNGALGVWAGYGATFMTKVVPH